jgi:hypothetical protein
MSERRRPTANLTQFAQATAPASAPDAASPSSERTRGKGAFVGMTLRLARAEGVSLNALALRGLARLFVERGVPPL